jgi:hypothetical protein
MVTKGTTQTQALGFVDIVLFEPLNFLLRRAERFTCISLNETVSENSLVCLQGSQASQRKTKHNRWET